MIDQREQLPYEFSPAVQPDFSKLVDARTGQGIVPALLMENSRLVGIGYQNDVAVRKSVRKFTFPDSQFYEYFPGRAVNELFGNPVIGTGLTVQSVIPDCDNDTLLYQVDQFAPITRLSPTIDLSNLNFSFFCDTSGMEVITAVVVDAENQTPLMVGWMNREAFEKTQAPERNCTFWSRSRKKIWTKGEEESGNFLKEKRLYAVSNDTVLVYATPTLREKGVCHLGTRTCFDRLPSP